MSSTRNRLIEILFNSDKEYISGEELSEKLNISRSAIWKHMNELKKDGYEIESKHGAGYKIVQTPNKLSSNTVKWGLNTKWLGNEVIHYESIATTQKLAHELAINNAKHGTIVIADEQTEARGRLGRKWQSMKDKTISLSMILRPNILPYVAPQLTLLTATVVAEVLDQLTDVKPKIKWPNDILINGHKVCGILTEMHAEQDQVVYVVIGLGINVNQEEDELYVSENYKATSLKQETNKVWDRKEIIQAIIRTFEEKYELFINSGFTDVKRKWEEYGFRINELITYKTGNEDKKGVFLGIAEDGALLMEQDDGRVERVYSAEISWF